jgi:multiple sugar transport system permease protein
MALTAQVAAPAAVRPRKPRRTWKGYAFVSGYLVLLIALGILPTVYALVLAFQKSTGHGFAGFSNFTMTAKDYRFAPAFENVAKYLGIWLVSLIVLVLGLSLLVHSTYRRLSGVFRFVYYLPGALVGAGSVIIWLFLLDPAVSPFAFFLKWIGLHTFDQTVQNSHLPVIFTLMAFWTGAGGWILVMYGALNNISTDLVEAATLDGCNAWQMALRIKLPLIKKWVAYMVILSIAGGTQLFVEPTIISSAAGTISPSWSPNELAYNYAFQQANFNGASAIALDLLVFSLACAAIIVTRSGLFERR